VDDDAQRPFYDEYAWAYDLIIPPPNDEQLDFVADAFARRGVGAGSLVLDAGCGVGRHALGLARRGCVVEGIDRSSRLVKRLEGSPQRRVDSRSLSESATF
jgi:SAM-dependent methyltransferase